MSSLRYILDAFNMLCILNVYMLCVPLSSDAIKRFCCVCLVSRAAVWSSYMRCVLKVTVSRGYVGVRLTEELQGDVLMVSPLGHLCVVIMKNISEGP